MKLRSVGLRTGEQILQASARRGFGVQISKLHVYAVQDGKACKQLDPRCCRLRSRLLSIRGLASCAARPACLQLV
jgi:hypothetical protein